MKDLLTHIGGDAVIAGGDFLIGESEEQHQEHIFKANKGDYKEFPEMGIGVEQLLSDDSSVSFIIEAKKNLEYDGMKINNITIDQEGVLRIDGNYK